MPVGLFPGESQNLPFDVGDVEAKLPMTQGLLSAPFKGVVEGVASLAAPLVGEGSVLPERFPQLAGPGLAALSPQAAMLHNEEVHDVSEKDIALHKAQAEQAFMDNYRSDPQRTGAAANIVQNLVSGLTRFGVGSLAGGPEVGALTVGATEENNTQQQLIAQHVDEGTAQEAGAIAGVGAGIGSMVPGGFGGTLLRRLLSGSASMLGQGIASRAAMGKVLDNAGYKDMAAQYQPLDRQAMLADSILGLGFGALHHVFAPSTIDAAHTILDSNHVEQSAPGGVPKDPASRQDHYDNTDAVSRAMLSGDDIPPLKDIETVPNPAQDDVQRAFMDEAMRQQAEAGNAPIEAYAGSERRADAADVARMTELRNKGLSNLTPDETGEYARLLESDRLAAKVGGRRIAGLLSREAYEERVAAGQQLPHVGYFDLDMFKDINDQFGSHAGDEVIRATGEAAGKIFGEGNAFKGSERAGDEFMVQGNSPEEIQSGIEALRQHLANHKIQAYDEAGNLIRERQGVDFSHGIGQTAREAEAAAKLEKQRRAAIGLRRNRGTVAEEPAGERGASAGAETTGPTAKARLIRPNDIVGERPLRDAYTAFLERGFKKKLMEEKGGQILDEMVEGGESPQDVAEKFWTSTYWNLPGEVQAKFDRMFQEHSGGLLPREYKNSNDLLREIDLGNDPETLQGTDRGFVVLMREANDRFAQAKQRAHGSGIRPVDQLAKSLEALRESNGTDEKAHAAARRILQSAADQGHDVGSIERAAVERAGADTGPLLAAVKASEKPLVDAAGLDPATSEAVDAAQRILARGDMTLKDEATNQVHSMREELVRAVQDAKNAREDGILHQVAAACGAR